jgi:hypothetical protein
MNAAIRALTTTAALALAIGLTPSVRAQASEPEGYADGYQSGTYGRIRFSDGGATIVRAEGQTDAGDRAGINAPIFPGDTLKTDGGQRVEVQLANGTLVRLDRAGELVFQSLPNPYAKYQDNTVLVLSSGSLRVDATLRDKEEFRIDTRDASVYVLGDDAIRIDADPRGGTRVSSQRGVAEVVGNDASVLVRGGTRTVVYAGAAPEDPRAYSAFATDGFDRWCSTRDAVYHPVEAQASGDAPARDEIPSAVQPYYGELSANGTWVDVPQYGTVWSPSGLAVGWQPYSNGYWSYGPGGYFWVSYEPWGWAPYHYGNWQWIVGRGWCWIPGPVFAGAWVSWSWGSLYVGWAPLDYWGRPGWAGGPYSYGYYDPGCWTFVGYGNVGYTNVHRYAVPIGTVGDDLRHATVVSRAPRVDPRKFHGNDGARERALREVANDGSAHLRPIAAGGTPGRTIADVQNQLMRRQAGTIGTPRTDTPTMRDATRGGQRPSPTVGVKARDPRAGTVPNVPGGGRETPVARPRRILEDPRSTQRSLAPVPAPGSMTLRPDPRDGVRDLYQRMSRPRETREPSVAPSTGKPSPRAQSGDPQATAQRGRSYAEPQKAQPRGEAPRAQGPPRSSGPAPQRAAPQRAAPQRANPPARPAPQAQPKHDKH